jgi:ABC-2 type transport system permease protein
LEPGKPDADKPSSSSSAGHTANASDEAAKPAAEPKAKPASPKKGDRSAAKEDAKSDSQSEEKKEEKKPRPIDVVYVADIDLMISAFLRIRARPGEDEEIKWNFENVTFLLNTVDVLSGDTDFIDIRKRKPRHATLRLVEAQAEIARQGESEERQKYQKKYKDEIKGIEEENKKAIEKFQKTLDEMKEKQRKEGFAGIRQADFAKAVQDLQAKQELLNRRLEVKREELRRDRDEQIERKRRETDLKILGIKNEYKFWAVALPPIPPLLVALVVFVRRRLREREGIAKSRLR